jgi:hypothetical protein
MLDILINIIQLFVLYWRQGVPDEVLFIWLSIPLLLVISEMFTRKVIHQPVQGIAAYMRLLCNCILLSGAWLALFPGLLHVARQYHILSNELSLEVSVQLAGVSLGLAASLLPLAVVWIRIEGRILRYSYIFIFSILYYVLLQLGVDVWKAAIELPILISIGLSLLFFVLTVVIPNLDYTDEQATYRLKGQHT